MFRSIGRREGVRPIDIEDDSFLEEFRGSATSHLEGLKDDN